MVKTMVKGDLALLEKSNFFSQSGLRASPME